MRSLTLFSSVVKILLAAFLLFPGAMMMISPPHRTLSFISGRSALLRVHSPSCEVNEAPYKRIDPLVFKKQVYQWRAAACAGIGLLAFNYRTVDASVKSFYEFLKRWDFFHHYAFEPILASTCFSIFIGLFAAIDHWFPSLWKYRIQPPGERGDSMDAWKHRLVDALKFEVPLYLGVWIPFGGLVKARKIQESTSLALVVFEVAAALILYDLFFFVGHNVLHRIPGAFKAIHSKHHAMKTVRAGDSVRHSFIDGFWDVVCAVAALMILKANALSRSLFNVIAIGLIVEAHSGLNFPWALNNLVPFQLVGGAVAHDLHHLHCWGNFAKFFTYLDRLFKTNI